jgi:hypothetical protein
MVWKSIADHKPHPLIVKVMLGLESFFFIYQF